MKKNRWKLGIAMGMALAVMAGDGRLDVSAAANKTEENGQSITGKDSERVKTARHIPIDISMKIALGTEGGSKEDENREADGIKYIENGQNEGNAGNGQMIDEADAQGAESGTEAGGTDALGEGNAAGSEAIGMGNGEESGNEEAGQGGTAVPEENAEEIDAYFDGSVFVGDSIMLGFRNYAMKRQDTFLSRMGFLAAGSFSANNALWEVGGDSVHPVYQGEQRQIWESISLMGSKKVFIMLGMNDLNITGLEGTCEKYEELIGKIKEANPETEIHIMSMTYVLKGKEAGKLNNDTIREYNGMLKAMAEENGWGYVEVADALADGNGDLAEEYCSDGFAHQNPEAYDVWVSVLRKYAGEHL